MLRMAHTGRRCPAPPYPRHNTTHCPASLAQADPELGEVGGVFQTIQETGDDMGGE